MANVKKTSEISAEEQVQTSVIDTEKEQMKSQIEQLTVMVQQLLASQNTPKQEGKTESNATKEKNFYYDIEDELEISPSARIKIMSLTVGGLNLRALHNIVSIPAFGRTIPVSFEDLRHIVNNHPALAREGAFIILNEKAVKALYLENDYQNLLGRSDIESIIDKTPSQIEYELKKSTKPQIQAIVHQFLNEISNGNPKYLDRNKLIVLSDFVGTDIYQLATELSK